MNPPGPEVTFSKQNLNVTVQVGTSKVTWYPKTIEEESLGGNLKGTLRVSAYVICSI